ncbi:hypothetical protein [Pontibacter sp. G13]|uniref:hypothetical protein n=1 Tax=Pontibacter sp. G13 TaxID=3074898 RepID=UPI00288BEE7D|nr:hypothetical protein [Pontibacter sp. G13]WNJ18283.1 hypothetical protein RJD25_25810 [Pontibacter sp. G13]
MARTLLSFLLVGALLWGSCQHPTANTPNLQDLRIEVRGVSVYSQPERAQSASSVSGKPIFVIFDSPVVGSSKCTQYVFEVLKTHSELQNEFELLYLNLDNRTRLDTPRIITENGSTKKLRTVGDEHLMFMFETFHGFSNYLYAVLDEDLEIIKEPIDIFRNQEEVLDYLQD